MENHTPNLSDPVSHARFPTLQGLLTTLRKIPGATTITRLLQRPVTAALLVSLFVLVTIAGEVRLRENESPGVATQQELIATPHGPAQIVRFTVYDSGIFPHEARVSAGSVALHMEDMSGNSTGLTVASESLQTMAHVIRRPQRWRDNATVSLPVGRYTVYDASRPTHRATLIVEP